MELFSILLPFPLLFLPLFSSVFSSLLPFDLIFLLNPFAQLRRCCCLCFRRFTAAFGLSVHRLAVFCLGNDLKTRSGFFQTRSVSFSHSPPPTRLSTAFTGLSSTRRRLPLLRLASTRRRVGHTLRRVDLTHPRVVHTPRRSCCCGLFCFVFCCIFSVFRCFLLFLLLIFVGSSLLVCIVDFIVVETVTIGDRFAAFTDAVRKPSVLILCRHPLGCRDCCLLAGVRDGLPLPVAPGFALETASCGPSERTGSFMTHFLLFVCNFCTVVSVIRFVVGVLPLFQFFSPSTLSLFA